MAWHTYMAVFIYYSRTIKSAKKLERSIFKSTRREKKCKIKL